MAVPFDQRPDVIWFDGRLIPTVDCKISVLTHGLHYASAVFEGERAYGGEIFKGTAHSERLKKSARDSRFRDPLLGRRNRRRQAAGSGKEQPEGRLCSAGRVARLGSARRFGAGQQDPPRHRHLGMAELFRSGAALKGIRLDLAEYRRPDPKTAPCLAKAAGLYMICTISKHRAEQRGYADAMMLDWQGRVAECTGANIFFVKDGKIHTPIADCFLAGITRATVIGLRTATISR